MLHSFFSQFNNLLTFHKLFSPCQVINRLLDYPLTVNMLITPECNLSCQICSSQSIMQDRSQLKKTKIKGFIKNIARFNPTIFIGGGEPFLRADIFEIFRELKENKLRFGVVTNGVMLDQEKIDKILDSAPQVMIFSVHGPGKLHDNVVGQEGAFEKICKNISSLKAKRKSMFIILNCVIGEDSYKLLEEVVFIARKLRVDLIRFEHLIYLTNEEYKNHLKAASNIFPEHKSELSTYIKDIENPKMGQELKKIIPYLQKKYGKFVSFKPYLNSKELSSWYKGGFNFNRKCSFVQHSLFIKPNGDIVPCQFFNNFILGNILKDDLIKVWRSPQRRLFSRQMNRGLLPGCMRCCKL